MGSGMRDSETPRCEGNKKEEVKGLRFWAGDAVDW